MTCAEEKNVIFSIFLQKWTIFETTAVSHRSFLQKYDAEENHNGQKQDATGMFEFRTENK